MFSYTRVGDAVIPTEGSASTACKLFGTETKRYTSEDRFEELLKERGVTGYVRHPDIYINGRRYVLDFCFPEHKLDVEIDGYEHQHERRVMQRDRERDEQLKADGWAVLRFSTKEIHRKPKSCLRLLERVLRKTA